MKTLSKKAQKAVKTILTLPWADCVLDANDSTKKELIVYRLIENKKQYTGWSTEVNGKTYTGTFKTPLTLDNSGNYFSNIVYEAESQLVKLFPDATFKCIQYRASHRYFSIYDSYKGYNMARVFIRLAHKNVPSYELFRICYIDGERPIRISKDEIRYINSSDLYATGAVLYGCSQMTAPYHLVDQNGDPIPVLTAKRFEQSSLPKKDAHIYDYTLKWLRYHKPQYLYPGIPEIILQDLETPTDWNLQDTEHYFLADNTLVFQVAKYRYYITSKKVYYFKRSSDVCHEKWCSTNWYELKHASYWNVFGIMETPLKLHPDFSLFDGTCMETFIHELGIKNAKDIALEYPSFIREYTDFNGVPAVAFSISALVDMYRLYTTSLACRQAIQIGRADLVQWLQHAPAKDDLYTALDCTADELPYLCNKKTFDYVRHTQYPDLHMHYDTYYYNSVVNWDCVAHNTKWRSFCQQVFKDTPSRMSLLQATLLDRDVLPNLYAQHPVKVKAWCKAYVEKVDFAKFNAITAKTSHKTMAQDYNAIQDRAGKLNQLSNGTLIYNEIMSADLQKRAYGINDIFKQLKALQNTVKKLSAVPAYKDTESWTETLKAYSAQLDVLTKAARMQYQDEQFAAIKPKMEKQYNAFGGTFSIFVPTTLSELRSENIYTCESHIENVLNGTMTTLFVRRTSDIQRPYLVADINGNDEIISFHMASSWGKNTDASADAFLRQYAKDHGIAISYT